MTKQEKKEIFPTLKILVKEDDDNGVVFKDMQVNIVSITSDVETIHGKKIVAVVQTDKQKYSVFVNATSINKLIDAFGEDDELWTGKICNLKKEKDKKFNNQMIVFYPVK